MKNVLNGFVYIVLLLLVVLTGCGTTRYASRDMLVAPDQLYDQVVSPSPKGLAVALPGRQDSEPPVGVLAAAKDRLVVYHGTVALLVDSISERMDRTLRLIKDAGGYMQSIHDTMVVVKIPAAKFEDVLFRIEALGEVTYKNIVGEDVTDQMRDYRIRLKNAEQIRDRLASLLERAEKVEDALKIERELGRVTETIELLKGRIQNIENQIAFSTLTVKFNSPLPQQTVKQEIPFPWVLQLGGDLVTGRSGSSRYRNSRGRDHVKFDLPKSFAKYEDGDYRTRATSADGVLLKVERHGNVKGADLAFWTEFIRRALVTQRAIRVKDVAGIQIHRGRDGVILSGVKDIAGKPYGYLVAVTQTDKYVVAYEAWGPLDTFNTAKPELLRSIGTISL